LGETVSESENNGWWMLVCDGGAKGDPGPASGGGILTGPDGQEYPVFKYLGTVPAKTAPWRGLIVGLEEALSHGARGIQVFMRNPEIIGQLQEGVEDAGLRLLERRVHQLLAGFEHYTLGVIPD
jgi:ribonuclease HI